MTGFQPIPAVDIRAGRCVQLVQGDFARETAYGDDPAEMARHWQAEGAQRLHVVDLDGARDGVRGNAAAISKLLASVDIPVQVGGGVRSLATARALLEQGADRVVVGTAAAEHPDVLTAWIEALGAERLIIGVDARNARVATRGWQNLTDLDVPGFCQALVQAGVRRVLYTDVGRDGMLGGPDIDGTRAVAKIVGVLASGGVSSAEQLRALKAAGAEGAIIGSALYEGRLTLSEALAATAC
ncbi:MAG TPA: 1-(5-phosphoribosyl)-5-[(5-phosphoribosylamino)methylideneamino]imidazole-4-carboxamide isomerase [Chloroflexota bacterium]|nr:1-(5-phosphoribosyl)-5-[(5-phosphoribosylamino)methylideneamino]imidazole-4-carboxamide isomerase [Chloroflexota bacterium]